MEPVKQPYSAEDSSFAKASDDKSKGKQKHKRHGSLTEEFKQIVEPILHKYSSHGLSDTATIAYYNAGISDGEKNYLQKRLPITKAACETVLNRKLDEHSVPKITMICSGGGYRAMLCTAGSLCGAHKIGLLKCTTHLSTLSGSTWTTASWIATGKPITLFREYLKECAAKSFTECTIQEEELIAEAILKKLHKSPFTPVDPYGYCLANRLLKSLKENRHAVTLSSLAQQIEKDPSIYPYPVFVAIDGRESIITGQTWSDFTVHTVRDHNNNIHIPTKLYGTKFKKGKPSKHIYEESLGYNMGTWGSAFGANIHEILKEMIKDPALREAIESKIPKSIDSERPLHFYAEVPNYMREIENIKDTTLSKEKYLQFVDAGLEINLPYPPVSGICPERKADILIFLDASAGPVGEQLQNVVTYAQKNKLPFPTIDFKNINNKTISVFKDETNKEAPVVIYMPRISDPELWQKYESDPEFAQFKLSGFDLDHETNNGFAKTKEFQYKPEQSDLIMDQTEFNMRVNKDVIKEAINWWIDRK
jgi:hypothetical protein